MQFSRRKFLLTSAAAFASCRHRKSAGFDGYAFVANQDGQAVAAIDLNTFTLSRHISLDARPASVVSSSAHRTVYALTPDTGTVYAIGASDLRVSQKLRIAPAVPAIQLAPDGSRLWALSGEPGQVVAISPQPMRVEARIWLPFSASSLDVSREGGKPGPWAVALSRDRKSFCLIDLQSGRVRGSVAGDKVFSAVRFRSDGKLLIAGNVDDRQISLYRVPDLKVVAHLPLAVRPDNFCFKSDGGQLFVTGDGMDAVAVVYPYSTEVAETVLAGHAPGAMASLTTEDFDYLFVANPLSGDVTIMDVETRKAIAAVAVGEEPGFITTTPDGQYALVLNRRSGDMSVIRVSAIQAKRARLAPLFTMIPVGSRPVSATVLAV